jgi:HD-like signal output (HDOD) protein
MSTKLRVLFADGEPLVLEGMSRMLHVMRGEWEMCFVTSGEQALNEMKVVPFDVVVADIRMPRMNGLQLLTEVKDKFPEAVRLILSGHQDHNLILQSIGIAHQYLSKPCNAEELKKTVNRAVHLRNLAANKIIKQLLSRISTLPSLPALYHELVQELQSEDVSIKKLGDIISKDMSMAAKILQLVNSAFFGLRRQILDVGDAVVYLGLETIHTLALSVHAFSRFGSIKVPGLSLEKIWSHSLATGVLAKKIAQTEMLGKEVINDAFTAGLLHDLGRVILAFNLPREYGEAMAHSHQDEILLCEAEQRLFETTHAEVGAYLLELWGLPDSILESIALHHHPSESPSEDFCLLSVVHIADSLESGNSSSGGEDVAANIDIDYLSAVGIEGNIAKWRQSYQNLGIGDVSQ